MNEARYTPHIISWLFGAAVFAVGVLNLIFVHPVPAVVYVLLSTVYLAPTKIVLGKSFGFPVPVAARIALGVFIVWFTLGVSDVGDMIDKRGR